jgi:hypothetical protein
MACKQCLLCWTWHMTEKTVSAKGRDNKTPPLSSFLTVTVDSQLQLPLWPKSTFVQFTVETLLNLSLTVAIDSDLQLPLWPELILYTIHSWRPFSLAVAIDSDLQLPLWLESTYVQRWPFLSCGCNRQPTYNCLLWPESTFVQFTAENNNFLQLQSTANLWLPSVARIVPCTIHGQNPPLLWSQSTANLQLSPWPESYNSWLKTLSHSCDRQSIYNCFCSWNRPLYNLQPETLSLSQSQSTFNLRLPSVAGIVFCIIYSWKRTSFSHSHNLQLTYNCLCGWNCTIHSRNTFSCSCNWQSTYNCLCGQNCTTHSWKPLSLVVAIDSDLQLPLWLESTYVQRWPSSLTVTVDTQVTIVFCGWNQQLMAENPPFSQL